MYTLYVYECCPFCMRARLILAAKNIEYEKKILAFDDKETTQKLANINSLPILVTPSGEVVSDSMKIVDYLDKEVPEPSLDKRSMPETFEKKLHSLFDDFLSLWFPRLYKLGFPEFKNKSAQEYFINARKEKFPNLLELFDNPKEYIKKISPLLDFFAENLQTDHYVYKAFSKADIELFPILRALSAVKGLPFPDRLKKYMEYRAKHANVKLLFNRAI